MEEGTIFLRQYFNAEKNHDYPCNFVYRSFQQVLTWKPAEYAAELEITYSRSDNSRWNVLYRGPKTDRVEFSPPPGIYLIKGKRKRLDGRWESDGPHELVTIFDY